MINGQTVLSIIPARGGSKGLPKKNLLSLSGKPLIAWTIEAANQSEYIDRCIVSTDNDEISEIAKMYNCEVPFIRPKILAKDDSIAISVIKHAITFLNEKGQYYDIVIVLQPTSPLRTGEDIEAAIALFAKNSTESVVSMVEVSHPVQWTFQLTPELNIIDANKFANTRRQDFEKRYSLNGAIYISRVDSLFSINTFLSQNTVAYVMPEDRSIDIDNQFDFDLAEYFINKNTN